MRLDPMIDRAAAQAEFSQLPEGDDPMLASRQPGNGRLPSFFMHVMKKDVNPPIRPSHSPYLRLFRPADREPAPP